MGQHVLVVGGYTDAHKLLKRLGFRLTIINTIPKIAKAGHLDLYDRVIGLSSAATSAEWVAQAKLIHRLDPVHHLAGFNEPTELYAAAIAVALSLPFHRQEVIERIHYKDRMREQLRSAGVDPTASRIVTTATEIAAFAADYGYPVVLKPVDGRASSGVSLVRSESDIDAAVNWLSQGAPGSRMLAEEFLHGEEFSVEAMSEGGRHRILAITRKFKEPVHFVEVGHCVPALLDLEVTEAIHTLVSRALTALGVQFGPTHTEVMVTAGGPRIVETHTRLGGDCIPDLVQLATGIDPLELWVRQTIGEHVLHSIPQDVPLQNFAAIWYVSPSAIGTLQRVDGTEEVGASPHVVKVEVLQTPGTKVGRPYDSFSRGASVIATGASEEEAVEAARAAAGKLQFVVS